jgi:serine protease Do
MRVSITEVRMNGVLPLIALSSIVAEGRRTPVVEVVEKAGPAVVSVGAEIVEENPFRRSSPFDSLWREFYGMPQQQQRTKESLGSGVIIDKTGLVLTNEHVVARATSITITLRDRRTFEADVVGADTTFDVAVLRIRDAKDLPVVELGTSSDLMPGETVVAIGNPFGLSNTVTTGVVSALHRSVPIGERAYEDFVQTDAPINPGNSGGALLNIEAKLIGINTAIYGSGTGIGFAIPIDKATAVVEEVLRYGEVRPAFLGLVIDPTFRGGARIAGVDPDSPAKAAGLEAGDIIIDIGGSQISDPRVFAKLQRALVPGQQVKLRYTRRGQQFEADVRVKELTLERASAIGRARLGLEVRAQGEGLVISAVRPGSDAARIGMRKGDALLSLAGRRLRTMKDFEAICAALRDAEAVAVIIGRGGRRYYVTLELG